MVSESMCMSTDPSLPPLVNYDNGYSIVEIVKYRSVYKRDRNTGVTKHIIKIFQEGALKLTGAIKMYA